jgi:hypothetical protein
VNSDDFEITVSDVSDVAATVCVRYRPAAEDSTIAIRGTLRGPYCEKMRTLVAEFSFRDVPGQAGSATALVTDPCLWSPELPHLYQVDLAARRDGDVVAEYHGTLGLHGPAAKQLQQ